VPAASNGEAAARAAGDPTVAALAGDPAQARYGLRAEARCVEDAADNCTRFFVLGRQPVPPSGDDRTSLVVTTKNEPGALLRVLELFGQAGLNLLRVESRPARRGQWTYAFFIDLEGHQAQPEVADVLAQLGERAVDLRILGSYPRPAR
jgi:chorismate mutase/prephenate dehydratase